MGCYHSVYHYLFRLTSAEVALSPRLCPPRNDVGPDRVPQVSLGPAPERDHGAGSDGYGACGGRERADPFTLPGAAAAAAAEREDGGAFESSDDIRPGPVDVVEETGKEPARRARQLAVRQRTNEEPT